MIKEEHKCFYCYNKFDMIITNGKKKAQLCRDCHEKHSHNGLYFGIMRRINK